MTLVRWSEIAEETLNPKVTRRVLNSASMTVARLALKAGCVVPTHHHVNEQISTIESGCLRFVVGGETVDVKAGESLVIPPNVPHTAEALEDTVALDIFNPVREDWARGDDQYLRG